MLDAAAGRQVVAIFRAGHPDAAAAAAAGGAAAGRVRGQIAAMAREYKVRRRHLQSLPEFPGSNLNYLQYQEVRLPVIF
jgi:hypothetical protein